MIKSKKDIDYSFITKTVYLTTLEKFPYNIKISSFMDMFRESFELKEWTLYEPKNMNLAMFESYLIDRVRDYIEGKSVDFGEVYKSILKFCDFTRTEIITFEQGNVQDRIRGIFMALDDRENKNNITL